jgi:hypothetical protein
LDYLEKELYSALPVRETAKLSLVGDNLEKLIKAKSLLE